MIETDISTLKGRSEDETFTIYSLVNLDNKKRYIGRTKNPKQRINHHLMNLRYHNHPNTLLNRDSDCRFGFEILEESILYEQGKDKERFYIEKYHTHEFDYGYNGKDHCVSTILNPPQKEKIFIEEMSINIQKIKRLREKMGLSQEELASLIGASSKSAICKYEKKKRNVTFQTLNKIARALDCSPLSLIKIEEHEVEG